MADPDVFERDAPTRDEGVVDFLLRSGFDDDASRADLVEAQGDVAAGLRKPEPLPLSLLASRHRQHRGDDRRKSTHTPCQAPAAPFVAPIRQEPIRTLPPRPPASQAMWGGRELLFVASRRESAGTRLTFPPPRSRGGGPGGWSSSCAEHQQPPSQASSKRSSWTGAGPPPAHSPGAAASARGGTRC